MRRGWLSAGLLVLALAPADPPTLKASTGEWWDIWSAVALAKADARTPPFSVVEAGIPQMREALARKRVTSRELVLQYLTRIAAYEDRLHAAITVNPHALEEADVARPGTGAWAYPRTVAWNSDCAEGQYPDHGYAHDRRSARFRTSDAAL